MYFPTIIMFPAFGFELKGKRRRNGAFVSPTINDIVLSQVRVYHERVYPDNIVSKIWLVRSFSSQHHSKFFANITSENVSRICTKKCNARSFICKVNLNFLGSSRHLTCCTALAVIVSFLNENVHGFSIISNGGVRTVFQMVKFWKLWKFCYQKS